jgi:hypothetical protein
MQPVSRAGIHLDHITNFSLEVNLKFRDEYTSFFCIISFIVVLGGGTLWHLQKFLQSIKYIAIEFTPSTVFHYLSLHSLNSFGRYHFSVYIYVYTILHHIHPLSPFPPGRTCFALRFSDFV